MLPPHELKNKTFSRVIRGYSSIEVDEHIKFMIDRYTELYRQNDELERALKAANDKLEVFKSDEESIRSALINAQRASSKILNDANERADVIVRSAKSNCDKILADFREQVRREYEILVTIRGAVDDFKKMMFTQYQEHIEYIENISSQVDDSFLTELSDEEYTRIVVERMKNDISGAEQSAPAAIGAANTPEVAPSEPEAAPELMPEPAFEPEPTADDNISAEPSEAMPEVSEASNELPDIPDELPDIPELDDIDESSELPDIDEPDVVPEPQFMEEPELGSTVEYVRPENMNNAQPEEAHQSQRFTLTRKRVETARPSSSGELDGFEDEPVKTEKSGGILSSLKKLDSEADTDSMFEASGDTKTFSRVKADNAFDEGGDDDYLDFIENVTGAERKKDAGSDKKTKNDRKPLTPEEEFELAYSSKNNKRK